MLDVRKLSDDEIESCIDGSSNIEMIRDILTRHGVVGDDGFIDPEIFADWFANGIEDYIDADPDSKEWDEANENNWMWGYDIADNINSLLIENEET
jgi:hypothetical protein